MLRRARGRDGEGEGGGEGGGAVGYWVRERDGAGEVGLASTVGEGPHARCG
jgi:hypothetical protein